MKKRHPFRLILWSLLVIQLLWLDSCKKNDDNSTTPAATIVGSYKISTLTVNPSILGLSDLKSAASTVFNSTCLADLVITFNNDGTATTTNPADCQKLPASVSSFTGIDASSKWTQSGSILTVTKGDGTKTDYTVVSNANNVLKLQWQGLFNYPVASTTMYTYTMELNKQ